VGVELTIRALAPEDDRSAFTCGNLELDRFFHHYAGQNQFKLNLSMTYVAVAAERIVGFLTVSAATIERAQLPAGRKKLPAYPLPALRLARLAVAATAQGMGVGRELLAFALTLAKRQRALSGCVGVLADAKPDAVAFYEKYAFGTLGETSIREGTIPSDPTPMFLSIDSIP